jgi:hypothetical protein
MQSDDSKPGSISKVGDSESGVSAPSSSPELSASTSPRTQASGNPESFDSWLQRLPPGATLRVVVHESVAPATPARGSELELPQTPSSTAAKPDAPIGLMGVLPSRLDEVLQQGRTLASVRHPPSPCETWLDLVGRLSVILDENPYARAITNYHGGPEWLVEQLVRIGPETAVALAKQEDSGIGSLTDLVALDDLNLVVMLQAMVA